MCVRVGGGKVLWVAWTVIKKHAYIFVTLKLRESALFPGPCLSLRRTGVFSQRNTPIYIPPSYPDSNQPDGSFLFVHYELTRFVLWTD